MVLHLHRLEYDQDLAGFDRVADRTPQLDNRAGHGRHEAASRKLRSGNSEPRLHRQRHGRSSERDIADTVGDGDCGPQATAVDLEFDVVGGPLVHEHGLA